MMMEEETIEFVQHALCTYVVRVSKMQEDQQYSINLFYSICYTKATECLFLSNIFIKLDWRRKTAATFLRQQNKSLSRELSESKELLLFR